MKNKNKNKRNRDLKKLIILTLYGSHEQNQAAKKQIEDFCLELPGFPILCPGMVIDCFFLIIPEGGLIIDPPLPSLVKNDFLVFYERVGQSIKKQFTEKLFSKIFSSKKFYFFFFLIFF